MSTHADLHRELQGLLSRMAAIFGELAGGGPPVPTVAAAPSPRKRAPRRNARTWAYQGQQLTARELAGLAGINVDAMRERLTRLTPEAAVAQGQAKFQPGTRRTFELDGQQMTVGDLAARAGVSWCTMWQRLQRHSPEVAISFEKMPRGIQRFPRKSAEPKGEPPPLLASARVRLPKAAAAPTPKPTQEPTRAPTSAPTAAPTKASTAPTSKPTTAPVIVPADVKRTVAKAPPSRYEVQRPPATFGRIGQYERTGSAVERQYERKA